MRQQEFMSYDPELWRLVPTTLRCQVLFLAEVKSAYQARHFANPSLTRTEKTGSTCDSEPYAPGIVFSEDFSQAELPLSPLGAGWAAIITTWLRLSCHHHRLAQAELPSSALGAGWAAIITTWRRLSCHHHRLAPTETQNNFLAWALQHSQFGIELTSFDHKPPQQVTFILSGTFG